jgi:hypothetical protein
MTDISFRGGWCRLEILVTLFPTCRSNIHTVKKLSSIFPCSTASEFLSFQIESATPLLPVRASDTYCHLDNTIIMTCWTVEKKFTENENNHKRLWPNRSFNGPACSFPRVVVASV